MAKFDKGHAKIGGRKKGVPNKYTTVKQVVFDVFSDLQNDPKVNLFEFAKKHPKDFYLIAAKLIPTEITGTDKLRFHITVKK